MCRFILLYFLRWSNVWLRDVFASNVVTGMSCGQQQHTHAHLHIHSIVHVCALQPITCLFSLSFYQVHRSLRFVSFISLLSVHIHTYTFTASFRTQCVRGHFIRVHFMTFAVVSYSVHSYLSHGILTFRPTVQCGEWGEKRGKEYRQKERWLLILFSILLSDSIGP